MKAKFILAALLAAASSPAFSQAHLKYFGYWANNSYQPENKDHTNITHIWVGVDDTYDWDSAILSELNQAKANGLKAMVIVSPYLFNGGGSWSADPDATNKFSNLVNKLIQSGHLVSGNPAASTIAAFYPVDEPELHGLSDNIFTQTPHPALANAVNVIRNNPHTSNFPIAIVSSKKYSSVLKGLRLVDWVGLDNYAASNSDYLTELHYLTTKLRPEQRTIVVPQAGQGGGLLGDYGSPHDPSLIYEYARADSRVIMVMPFLWGHSDTTGTRSIPSLRDAYTTIGRQIKAGLTGAPTKWSSAGWISASPNPCTVYAGQTRCTSYISWNSWPGDAEVWVSNLDGSYPQLFDGTNSGSSVGATWIATTPTRFTLIAGNIVLNYVDVYGTPAAGGGGGGGGIDEDPCSGVQNCHTP